MIVADLCADRLADGAVGQYKRAAQTSRPIAAVTNTRRVLCVTGGVVDDVDRSCKRRGSEIDGRGPAHHLDAFDVVQADRLNLWNECAAGRNAVDEEQQIIDL